MANTLDKDAIDAVEENLNLAVDQQVENVSRLLDTLIEFAVTYGFQFIGALLFLVIGLKVAKWAGLRVDRLMGAKHIDQTLARFIGNIVKIVIIVMLVIITLGNFGISTAPLIALAGASAFGATMAIQGPLSNYGAGISIILTRPFAVGNTITVNRNVSGVVEDITLAHTILTGEDGERITIPNKEIVGRVIVNSDTRRVVQTKICIEEGQDWQTALSAIRDALATFEDISAGPSPQVGVHDFTYGGIILGVRFWVPSSQYFQQRYRVNEAVLATLGKAGIKLLSAGSLAVIAPDLSEDDEEADPSIV
jgi:small conductance mechanosensitive channel